MILLANGQLPKLIFPLQDYTINFIKLSFYPINFSSVYLQVSKIGVFSCGPRPLTKSVMSACDEVNKTRKLPYFIHHFENFG